MRCASHRSFRRCVSQLLCFSLLLQTVGIAEALPSLPKQSFVSKSELGSTRPAGALPHSQPDPSGTVGGTLARWLENLRKPAAAQDAAPVRVAQASGTLPLSPRLLAALFASPAPAPQAPPSPPRQETTTIEDASAAELAKLLEKSGTDQVPLAPGANLISIPNQPPDPDPAAVFAPIAGELAVAVTAAACGARGPWLRYDPADPAGSDLTAVDHEIGMWVTATAPTLLPVSGTLPATTTIELCDGWNLIGFPAGEPRHPQVALSSIAGKWLRIFGYDAFDPEDPWEFFDVAVPDWANDLREMKPGRGYWVLTTEATTLTITNQGPPPTVALAAPADLAVVTEPTDILGTVASDRFDSWTLTSRPIGDGEAVTLAAGNAPVSGATLANFDPTLLLNGLYEFELTATDVQGQQVSESIAVSVEGQMKIGHFTLSFVDLAVPVSGLDIEIVRTYDSRAKQQRDFGVGWSLDIRQGSYRNNRPPGDGWQLQTGFVACDSALESKSHLTVVRLSDQEVYRFALRLVRGVPRIGGGCSATAEFEYIDGPLPGTTLAILGNDQVFQETQSSNRVLDADTLATYEPRQVRLTTRDGRIFELDLTEGVTLLEDLNGNQLSISPSGITHSSGKGVEFERDAEGRIERIIDPLDRVNAYGYDAVGDLVSFTDRAGAVTRFTYDDHRLRDIEDPRGVKPIRNEYDADGRLVRHIDAFGKIITLGHDRENRREVVTNRLGASRVLQYDARGNVVGETDELGKVTISIFDSRDNLLSETDPLGRKTSYTYTPENELAAETDPLGNVTSYTYNGRSQLLNETDPRGGVLTNVFDARGNLSRTTDAAGGVTTFTYDTRGQVLTITDPAVTTFEYDAFGNLTKETDALGHETLSTYDNSGNRLTETRTRTLADGSVETLTTQHAYDDLDRVVTTIAADGSSNSVTYALLGNATSRTDASGRETSMEYDLMGQLTTTSLPDGSAQGLVYDAEGRVVTQIDRAGRATTFTHDAAGRPLTATLPDGSTTATTYDAAGQVVATTNARGHTTTYAYDAAGRRTATIDALGSSWSSTYDDNGNEASRTDPRGHTTTFTYDALDRLITTQYPDGTTTEVVYDARGRVLSETDPAGLTTELAYDAAGRLETITDALGQVTRHGYDEVGNRISQTDANGHTIRFEYDSAGRQTRRILPGGAEEIMSYHADGTLASHMDFNGVTRTYEYDAAQRLIRRAYPDGSEDLFAYTPAGQPASATHAGETMTYAYDVRGRLIEKVDPTGHALSYTYDSQGGVTSLAATVGAQTFTTTYAYDALDRLTEVTGAQGEVTAFSYDASGNTAGIVYSTGVSTSFTYDARDRKTNLATVATGGAVLQSHDYTLGPAGDRTSVTEHDGTSRSYTHDDLYRLTRESVGDAAAALVYQRDFSYDAAGNRLQQTTSDGVTPATVASSYDTRDRLLTSAAATYGWDDNGNLLSRATAGSRVYAWDFENRLTSVTLEDGSLVDTSYDAGGNRLSTAVTRPDGSSEAVDYLVDTSGALSHVVAEIHDGQIQTLYTRAGDQLVSLYRPASGERRTYHGDALGSVRLLTDEGGAVTDRYTYSAFGELLEQTGSDPQPYRFAGEPFDPSTGDSYNRVRWMDPAVGRFQSMDPFEGFERQPATLHPYVYALNRPADLVDPSGLLPAWLARIIVGSRVHRYIGKDFELNVVGGRSDRWISTLARVKYGECLPNRRQCRRRPDLANIINGEVYEIKTTSPLAYVQGFKQLFEYIYLLNLNAPQTGWRPGISYKPPKRFILHGIFGSMRIRVFGPQAGLIQYTARSTTRLRTPGPGVSITLQQTLIVALMLASLMAAMRRPV